MSEKHNCYWINILHSIVWPHDSLAQHSQHLSVFTTIFSVKEAYFASYKVSDGFCPNFPSILSCPLYKLLQGLINISHWKLSQTVAVRSWVCCEYVERPDPRQPTNKFVIFCSTNLILLVPIVWTFGLTLPSHKKYHYCPRLTILLTGLVEGWNVEMKILPHLTEEEEQ